MIRPPKQVTTQLLVLLGLSVVAFQASVLVMQRFHPLVVDMPYEAQRVIFVVDALYLLPPPDRPAYLTKINAASRDAAVTLIPPLDPIRTAPLDEMDDLLRRQLLPHLPEGSSIAGTPGGGMQIRCPGDLVIAFNPTNFKPPTPRGGLIMASLGALVTCGILFVAYARRNIRRPLRTFAAALERFGIDQAIESVPEKGPTEIGTVARVLNQMQTRIKTMMEDRTRTLAALGHDLRTPITRLRLRADAIDDEPLRLAMIRDLDYMQRIAHSALSYLRDDRLTARAPIEIASLLQTICDDASELGEPVTYQGPEHLIFPARIDDLRRAVTNLVGNALFQEAAVTVVLRDLSDDGIEIDVVDDGPGIEDSEKDSLFEPFHRRGRDAIDRNGYGLGLSIVRNVARSHDGDVSLHDRPGGGLICRLRLPWPRDQPRTSPRAGEPARSATADV